MFTESHTVCVPRATTQSNDKRMTLSIKTRLPTPSPKDGNIFCFRKAEFFLWNSSRNQVILSVLYYHSKSLELTSIGISVALKSTTLWNPKTHFTKDICYCCLLNDLHYWPLHCSNSQTTEYIPTVYSLHTVDLAVAFVTDHFWFQQLSLQSCLETRRVMMQHINLYVIQQTITTHSKNLFS